MILIMSELQKSVDESFYQCIFRGDILNPKFFIFIRGAGVRVLLGCQKSGTYLFMGAGSVVP